MEGPGDNVDAPEEQIPIGRTLDVDVSVFVATIPYDAKLASLLIPIPPWGLTPGREWLNGHDRHSH